MSIFLYPYTPMEETSSLKIVFRRGNHYHKRQKGSIKDTMPIKTSPQ